MNYENVQIKVDGVVLPAPLSIDYGLEDLDVGSERDVKTGKLERNRIRSDMNKLSLVYGIDDTASISKVLKAISSEDFQVEMFDIKENRRVVKTMYAGPKSAQMIFKDNVWIKGLKFNLLEV